MIRTTLLSAACALAIGFSGIVQADEFSDAWAAADAKRGEAAKLGFEWRDTKKILKNAKKEADGGNLEKAMKLVKKAHEQSEDAIAQQAREALAWQSRVPQ